MRICTLFFCFWIDSHYFCLLISPPITLRKHLSALLWIQTRNLVKSTSSIFQKLHIYIYMLHPLFPLCQTKTSTHNQQTTNQQNQTNKTKATHTNTPSIHRNNLLAYFCIVEKSALWPDASGADLRLKNRGFLGDKLIPPLMTESL